ncbi:MAG TPA: RNA 2',3'-cyclic phosphodiesterase [Clostridia bacterium]|nr:RNA 2',3'-cyclic phosphodiesterase [Clostridia bacterium]
MADQETSSRARLFIALEVPEPVKQRLGEVQSQLRGKVPNAAIKWIPEERLHLTLRFLGYVEREQVPDLTKAAQVASGAFPPLALGVGEVGFFPNAQRPRIVWVGMSERENLLGQLAREVQTATLPFTAEEPADRFSAHITIGRVKGIARPQAVILGNSAEKFAGRVLGEWVGNECVLMESRLSAKGPTYQVLAKLAFRGE